MHIVIKLATIGVRNHPTRMFANVRFLTVLMPFTTPMPRTAPITAWEVETGRAKKEKMATHRPAEKAAKNAPMGVSWVILPTVSMDL